MVAHLKRKGNKMNKKSRKPKADEACCEICSSWHRITAHGGECRKQIPTANGWPSTRCKDICAKFFPAFHMLGESNLVNRERAPEPDYGSMTFGELKDEMQNREKDVSRLGGVENRVNTLSMRFNGFLKVADEKTAALAATINAHAVKIDKAHERISNLNLPHNASERLKSVEAKANRSIERLEDLEDSMKTIMAAWPMLALTSKYATDTPHGKYQKLVEACTKHVGHEDFYQPHNNMRKALEELGVG